MKPSVLTAFLFAIIASSFCLPSFAAEIININYKYKIAFADLTDNDVKPGDSVGITLSDGKTIRLKVLETYPVMVKLTSADGAAAVTDEQFAAITVGNQVTAGGKPGVATRAPVVPEKPRAVAAPERASVDNSDDAPAQVESYSPGTRVASAPVSEDKPAPVPRKVVKIEAAAAPVSAPAPEPVASVAPAAAVPPPTNAADRCAAIEQRLDQMVVSNVKLTENFTRISSEKAAAEDAIREKTAEALAAQGKMNDLASASAALTERVTTLTASLAASEKDNASLRKEIESLNLKLGELKKKLAKMVEIVNTNMKAYEKQ